MQIKLGEKIRELRHRDGRTQEELAVALSVTAQAVSRWEASGGYPDMELVPAIANYFDVSIDELFGYKGEREKKVDALLSRVDALHLANLRDDVNIGECLALLRDGLAEFPGNERIMYKLATVLSDAGFKRGGQSLIYGEDGYLHECIEKHGENKYWNEAIKLFETLLSNSCSVKYRNAAICQLIILYRSIGEYGKGISLSFCLPEIKNSREIMLADATDGKRGAGYLGEALLALAHSFSTEMVNAVLNSPEHNNAEFQIERVKGSISLFSLVCEDGNFGPYHATVSHLYLYLAFLMWKAGRKDDAFRLLENALKEARAYDRFVTETEPHYTAALLRYSTCTREITRENGSFAEKLSIDFPVWVVDPDCARITREIKADPRWSTWVAKTKSAF